jgi:hypothetical protein
LVIRDGTAASSSSELAQILRSYKAKGLGGWS